MKQKSSRRTVLAAAMAVAGVFGLITSPAFADVHVSQNGATLTVTAPSTLAGDLEGHRHSRPYHTLQVAK